MASLDPVPMKTPSAEQRRAAAAQYERANQVLASGDMDYGIRLLLECCKLDPGNLIYRKTLRGAQKTKHKNNLKGSLFSAITTAPIKLRLSKALRNRDLTAALEAAEEVLVQNPWDTGVQLQMAQVFEQLGLLDNAVWTAEQARQRDPKDVRVLRVLADLYEKRGNFTQANNLWELVRQIDPTDMEAQRKAKDLAACETIARGKYESALSDRTQAESETRTEHPALADRTGHGASSDRAAREIETLQARIQAEPTNPHAYLQLAALHRRERQLDQAREVLRQGLTPTKNDFDLAIELADLDIEPFRADLAVAEKKLREDRRDADLRQKRNQLLREINLRELDLYRRKAERHPTEMSHRLEMGLRLLRLGQVDEAIKELQTARTDPRHLWRALMYLGFCFKARKNWRLAQRNFEDALKQIPPAESSSRKEVLFQLAQGCAEVGDQGQALEWGYELANEDFNYRNIGQLLDQWQKGGITGTEELIE